MTRYGVGARLLNATGGGFNVEGGAYGATMAADLTPASVAELGLEVGTQVVLAVKATEVRIHTRRNLIERASRLY